MNWHHRYLQQAAWTSDLRKYLFDQAKLSEAKRVLEVGCGTGGVLSTMETSTVLHGLDLDPVVLRECHLHAPRVVLTCANGRCLPYLDQSFDVVFCHFFLLWAGNPLQALQEMKRVTRPNGHILAMAEPDYSARTDEPPELQTLGRWQNESLRQQGADIGIGARLADMFLQAGIKIIETGAIEERENEAVSEVELQDEWTVMESDVAGLVSREEVARLKKLHAEARRQGRCHVNVPTYFAWGQV